MARIPKRKIRIRRGDTYTHVVTEYADDGTLSNLTGNTFLVQLRTSPDATSPTVAFTTTILDAVNGSWQFSLTASQTENLPIGLYFYDVQRTYTDGTVHTRFEGEAEVEADISRA
jgi:hypothetical protein